MSLTLNRNIEIIVETRFEAEFSRPDVPSFIFSYKVRIVNNNSFPVKLEQREWIVSDSNSDVVRVRGEGVIGLTPTIRPGEHFEYTSNVNLKSGLGKMSGQYFFKNLHDGSSMVASIPEFKLEAEFMLN